MTKRHIALLAMVLACFAGAIFLIVWSTEQSRQRSAMNIEIICTELERITGMPCALKRPPSSIRDGDRRSESEGVMPAAGQGVTTPDIPHCPADKPVLISTSGVYHDAKSPYRRLVKPVRCFATIGEAQDAGFRPPG